MTEATSNDANLPNFVVADVPKCVKKACGHLIGSLIVDLCTLPSIIYSESPSDQSAILLIAAFVFLIFGALTAFLVLKLQKRKNWARWMTVSLVAVGVLMTVDSLADDWAQEPVVALLGVISAGMGIWAAWLLFNSQSNRWYIKQSGSDATTNDDTSLAYGCPSCNGKIPFFSKTVHSWGKVKNCPHCSHPIRLKLAYGKFFLLAFAIGIPVKMVGLFIPAFAFVNGSIFSGLLMGVFISLCLRFEPVAPNSLSAPPQT